MLFIKKSTIVLFIACTFSFAQNSDSLIITSKNLRVSNLKEGKSHYLVYFKNYKDAPVSEMQIWNLEIRKENYQGKKAITIYQNWDYKDTIVHTAKSISSAENFRPLYHESWWKMRGKKVFDLATNKVLIDDIEITGTENDPQKKSVYDSFITAKDYFLNWHLDLEVFSMLPYKKNVTFLVPFYEFGYDIPRNIAYTVDGEDIIIYNGKKIKCWLLKHEEQGNRETFWISKKTKEVLKMEQIINDKMYRYKYKLQD